MRAVASPSGRPRVHLLVQLRVGYNSRVAQQRGVAPLAWDGFVVPPREGGRRARHHSVVARLVEVQVCDAVAGGAGKAAEDLEHLYKTYGPQFGATAVWCKQMGCCNAE